MIGLLDFEEFSSVLCKVVMLQIVSHGLGSWWGILSSPVFYPIIRAFLLSLPQPAPQS